MSIYTPADDGPRGMPPDVDQSLPIGAFDDGSKIVLVAMILRVEGEYTEVAFPVPDGLTSHTVWLPSHVEAQVTR